MQTTPTVLKYAISYDENLESIPCLVWLRGLF